MEQEHLTRRELIAQGMTDRQIRAAVEHGDLVRARRGHYVSPELDPATARAIRVGGRLSCVSELRWRGVWVLDSEVVHVHVHPHATRLRRDDRVRLHWIATEQVGADQSHVSILEALVQASRCLDHRAWIASVDSALHLGVLHPTQLPLLSRALPQGRRFLVDMTDRQAESGLESIVRVIALELGLKVRSQVVIRGIGRVDLVIEDWIVVEADGSAFHDTALSGHDRMRDARLFATGRSVVRPGYSLVVHDQAAVVRQLIGAVGAHRRVKNSGRIVARARRRAEKMGFSGVVDPGATAAGRRPVSGRAARAPLSGSG